MSPGLQTLTQYVRESNSHAGMGNELYSNKDYDDEEYIITQARKKRKADIKSIETIKDKEVFF